MKVQIERSKEFVAKLMIETGENHTTSIVGEVKPELLSTEVREAIIRNKGQYPDAISYFTYDSNGEIFIYGGRSEGIVYFYLDSKFEDITTEMINSVMQKALDKIKNEIAPQLKEKRENEKKEIEQKVSEFLNNESVLANSIGKDYVNINYKEYITVENCTKYNLVREIAENRLAKVKAINEEKAKTKEAQDKKIAQKKRDTIDAWVETFGSDNQKGRHKLNLLSDGEILDEIRNSLFQGLDNFPRYEKIKGVEISCSCEYDEPTYEFNVMDSEEATAEEFELLNTFMSLMPEAKVVLRSHIGFCERCHDNELDDGEVQRKSILVTVEHGGFTFSREYAV